MKRFATFTPIGAPKAATQAGRAGTAGRVKPGHATGGGRAFLVAVLAACLLAFAVVRPAAAVEPSERLANPVLEARAEAIGSILRCLVCQNESIEESSADLAHDIRVFLRQRLVAGDTNQQAIQAVVKRYGQFVLLKPPVEPATYVLWFAPAGLLVFGFIGTVFWLRRRHAGNAGGATAPLSAAEQRRLDNLLQESEQ